MSLDKETSILDISEIEPTTEAVHQNESNANDSVEVKWFENLSTDDITTLRPILARANSSKEFTSLFENLTQESNKVAIEGKGIPKNAQAYEWTPPDGAQINEENDKIFRNFSHSIGLTNEQFSKINDFIIERMEAESSGSLEEMKETVTQEIEKLKEEWGDNFSQNITGIKNFIRHTWGEDGLEYINNSSLSKDAKFFLGLQKAIVGSKEDSQADRVRTNASTIQETIENIVGDLKSPYYDASHPAHERYVKKVRELMTGKI